MIKDVLSVLPTRPIIFIVPVMVVLVLSFYYWEIYSRCTSNQQFRASLNELLHTRDSGSKFRLIDITNFNWDRVRIVTDFEPENSSGECPFGWNWPGGERESLIADGSLAVLIFVERGTIVQFLELRSDEVEFRGADSSLAPQAAVFSVAKGSDSDSSVRLTLNP